MLKDFVQIVGDDFSKDILNDTSFKYDKDMFVMGAGLIVFYDTLNNIDELYDYCLNKTMQYSRYLLLPEQAIFSLMVWYLCKYTKFSDNQAILPKKRRQSRPTDTTCIPTDTYTRPNGVFMDGVGGVKTSAS